MHVRCTGPGLSDWNWDSSDNVKYICRCDTLMSDGFVEIRESQHQHYHICNWTRRHTADARVFSIGRLRSFRKSGGVLQDVCIDIFFAKIINSVWCRSRKNRTIYLGERSVIRLSPGWVDWFVRTLTPNAGWNNSCVLFAGLYFRGTGNCENDNHRQPCLQCELSLPWNLLVSPRT